MGVVVYNPTNSPVRTDAGQVDGKGWKYIEDEGTVQNHIRSGRLVVTQAPEDMTTVRPEAREAFDALFKSQSKTIQTYDVSTTNEPVQDESAVSKPKPSARKQKAGDTEVSETPAKSTTEKEA